MKISADYCQPCKSLTGILEKYGITNYEEIDICSEEGSLLTSKYRVRSVPTLIKIDGEGNVLDTLVGVKPDNDLLNWFSEVLY